MRKKNVIFNICSSVLFQIISIICGFVLPRLIIESYGSNVNGAIVSITNFLKFIILFEAGFGPVVKSLLYKPIAGKDKNGIEEILKTSEKFFKKIGCIFIIYIAILCVILPFVMSGEFDSIFTISLILIIAISTCIDYFLGMTYKLYLQAEQKTYIVTLIQIGTVILNTIICVVLIKLGANIQIVKLVSAIIFVARPIIQKIYVHRKYKIDLKHVTKDIPIKQKWDGLAQHIAFVIHSNTDIVILTCFTNIIEVSVYSVYMLIINSVKNIVQSTINGVDSSFGDMIAKNEHEGLNKNFKIFEGYYYTISTILFGATLVLITPFVTIYTNGITDANYIRPVFSYVMVIAVFIWAIRQPYNDLVKASGHFKQTKIGAIVEALINIIVSISLVWKFGIEGVAIGTLVAMIVRTIELICYTSKNILKRKIIYSFIRIGIITIEICLIIAIFNLLYIINATNYLEWIIQGILVTIICTMIVISINCIVYRENVKEVFILFKNNLKING